MVFIGLLHRLDLVCSTGLLEDVIHPDEENPLERHRKGDLQYL
jgi:hypothetical protein